MDTLGVGLGGAGVNGGIEGNKFCFCEVFFSIDVVCCFGGKECCVENGCSFRGETDGLGSAAGN